MSTEIAWTDETWNIATGCDRVSPGCDNCYIERTIPFRMEGRRFDEHGKMGIRLHPDRLDKPLHWRKPRRVFVNSLADLFHPDVPREFISEAWARMYQAHQHTFQVLTKRPQRMARVLAASSFVEHVQLVCEQLYDDPDEMYVQPGPWPPKNVWLGTSVENQRYADLRIPHLLATPAAVRFLSIEPLLGPVDLGRWLDESCGPDCDHEHDDERVPGIDWCIIGGESGPGHREMDVDWLVSIVEQCTDAGVPVFVKQDSGARSGRQGRIPDDVWAHKEFPA